ncbi:MAG: glycosyltransferase [Patescibacteria group bacterium]|nr:glycosyltransferase [Patescibacteria group bacterium]MDE2588849.1 glycosyltransferase [Patescibacteria group bacterium]
MKVALVYDRINKWGGAERVLLAINNMFPDAPLYTSVYSRQKAPWADVFRVIPSFLQNLPFSKKHELLAPLMPIAFEQFTFDEFDLVISVTSEAAKGILTKPHTKHLCICLTPTRYLWSGYEEYVKGFLRMLLAPLVWYLRTWDIAASSRPDKMVGISNEVRSRIKTYYNRESELLYPPLNEFFLESGKEDDTILKKCNLRSQSYFLVVSRLSRFTGYKRVDQAIAAANALKIPLVIAGDGDIAYFSSFAGPTVTFTGKVSDAQLKALYTHCKALVFPAHEDFGLVMAEVQACGRPVIAYNKGGAAEIVIHGQTGILYEKQTTEALTNALKNFTEKDYNSQYCKQQAQQFAFSHFEKHLRALIASL